MKMYGKRGQGGVCSIHNALVEHIVKSYIIDVHNIYNLTCMITYLTLYIIVLTGLLSPSKGVVTGSMGGVINDSGVSLPSGPVEWAGPDREWAGPDREWPWRCFLCVLTCSCIGIPDLI